MNLDQPQRSLARKVAMLMLLSSNHTFEMEKLEKQASEVHQELDGYIRRGSVGCAIPT